MFVLGPNGLLVMLRLGHRLKPSDFENIESHQPPEAEDDEKNEKRENWPRSQICANISIVVGHEQSPKVDPLVVLPRGSLHSSGHGTPR